MKFRTTPETRRASRARIFFRRRRVQARVRVVGVDGMLTSKGLVSVILRDGQLHLIHLVKDLDALLAEQQDADVIAVNLPLGHDDPEGARGGLRACDEAARRFLGPHADLVRPVPPFRVLQGDDLGQARETCQAQGWPDPEPFWPTRNRILTLQEKVKEDARFVEVQPEVSLTKILHQLQGKGAMLKRRPKSWPGQYERLSLLHVAGLRPMRSMGGVGRASPEDVIAATAGAWSAHRVAQQKAESLPDGKTERPCFWF